jgi:hypothetical protein
MRVHRVKGLGDELPTGTPNTWRDTPMELGATYKESGWDDPGDVPAWGRRDGALSLTVQPGMGHQCRPGEVYRSQP